MKVRLHDDSIRVRLSQREVVQLGGGEPIRAATQFAKGCLEVEIRPEGDGLEAEFAGSLITIRVAAQRATVWSLNQLEGLYSLSGPCKVAIEKDYACLHKTGDVNQGTFPNPSAL